MTRLYYTEPSLTDFDARVVQVVDQDEGRQRVWLDRTAFYPTSGGQPFDTGNLNGFAVAEVFDEDGQVVHLVEGRLSVGDAVVAHVDWPRRFDHMQQHTGQHVLSAAFEHVHGVHTESFRLGGECSTIDLAEEVTPLQIEAAENEANRIVWEGRRVSIRFVSEREALHLPLRKEPARSGPLRLIDIEGYDLSACGGTHVSTTSAIGMIAVRAWERFRGGTRLEFVCGQRALTGYRALRMAATAAARQLSVMPADLPAAVERLQADVKEARHVVATFMDKAAELESASLAARAVPVGTAAVLVTALDGYDASTLKRLAATFVKAPGRIIVLFTATMPVQVVAMRSGDLPSFDCGATLKALFARFGGRGGGKPESAQGGGLTVAAGELAGWARAEVERALGGT